MWVDSTDSIICLLFINFCILANLNLQSWLLCGFVYTITKVPVYIHVVTFISTAVGRLSEKHSLYLMCIVKLCGLVTFLLIWRFYSVWQRMQTNKQDVYAVGDITQFPLFMVNNKSVNIQHWQMAHQQGIHLIIISDFM